LLLNFSGDYQRQTARSGNGNPHSCHNCFLKSNEIQSNSVVFWQ
jgi:hypothetical protein